MKPRIKKDERGFWYVKNFLLPHTRTTQFTKAFNWCWERNREILRRDGWEEVSPGIWERWIENSFGKWELQQAMESR